MLGCHNEKLKESEIYLQILRSLDEPVEAEVELSTNEEIYEDPLSKFRAPSVKTTIISEVPSNCKLEQEITVAPGEAKQPILVLNDKFCEELAHPHLFPSGRYGYQIEREIPLSPSKHFNQRLLHYSQKCAADSDYIFFEYSVLQKVQHSSHINIAMKKVISKHLTAGMLSKTFKQRLKELIAKDKAFSFMSSVKDTPTYWKKFLHQVLAMVKQLGTPTFFLTLSYADIRWNELILSLN